ncbi:MAG: hypothetical protein H0V25_10610 [Solirubrobacterales bacterium]|nr:hypothetical protein [Solirubrobacterales bacterium]
MHTLKVPTAITIAVLSLLTAASSAQAAIGFGYGDPRSAQLSKPVDVAATPGGGFLMSQVNGVTSFSPAQGLVRVTGNGEKEPGRSPIPVKQASLFALADIEALPGGGFLVPEIVHDSILEVRDDMIRTIAGGSRSGKSAGPALSVSFRQPTGLAAGPDGSFLVADPYVGRIAGSPPTGRSQALRATGGPSPRPAPSRFRPAPGSVTPSTSTTRATAGSYSPRTATSTRRSAR